MQPFINHIVTHLNWFLHTDGTNKIVAFYNIIGGCFAVLCFFWILMPTEKVQRWWGILLGLVYTFGFAILWYGLTQAGRSPFIWFEGAILGFVIGVVWLKFH